MRQTKFRAQRTDNGAWVFGRYFRTPLTEENSGVTSDKGCFFLSDGQPRHCIEQDGVAYVVDEATLSEFTGQIDFKGTPVFEGDKIMATYRDWDFEHKKPGDEVSSPGLVEWYANESLWGVRLGDPDGESELWGMIKFNVLEVYGNIYENPDLLTPSTIPSSPKSDR